MTSAQGRVDGFYKGKGNADLVFGAGGEINNSFFGKKDELDISRTVISANVFAAYGLAENLDLNASIPFISTEGNSNLQDGALYFKYKILHLASEGSDLSLSLAAGASTNFTDYETEGIGAIGQQATTYDIRPVLHYWNNSGWFATAQFGILSKSSPTPDAQNFALKIGKAAANYYVDAWYEMQNSDGGLDYDGIPQPSTLKQLGVDYQRIGATFYSPINDQLGYYLGSSYTFDGRNVGKGPGIFAGIVLKR